MTLLDKLKRLITGPPKLPKVGRNDPCPCGSGKKFKNCHFEEVEAAGLAQQNAAIAKKSPLESARRAMERAGRSRKPKRP